MSPQDPTAAARAGPKTTQPDRVDEQQEEWGEEEEEEEGEEDLDSQQSPVVEKWKQAVDAVLEATRTAFPSSPAYDATSPAAFQSYWSGVFARVHSQVVSDRHIPEYLTSPPCTTFWVNVFAQGAGDEGPSCPCCLPEVEPSVRLENDAGVTKGDLVAGLGAFLYGQGLPRVYDGDGVAPGEEEHEDGQGTTGVLVHGADWMIEGGSGDDGERYVYGGGWSDRPAMIWMFCCPPGEFADKAAERAAAKMRRDEAEAEEEDEPATMAKL